MSNERNRVEWLVGSLARTLKAASSMFRILHMHSIPKKYFYIRVGTSEIIYECVRPVSRGSYEYDKGTDWSWSRSRGATTHGCQGYHYDSLLPLPCHSLSIRDVFLPRSGRRCGRLAPGRPGGAGRRAALPGVSLLRFHAITSAQILLFRTTFITPLYICIFTGTCTHRLSSILPRRISVGNDATRGRQGRFRSRSSREW